MSDLSGNFEKSNVMLVDHHAMFREVLAKRLSDEGDLQVVAQASSIGETMASLDSQQIDVMLASVDLPDGSGIDLVGQIKSRRPQVRIILLSAHQDEDTLIAAVKAGADGYLAECSGLELLLDTLRAVVGGQCVYEPCICSSALRSIVASDCPASNNRTACEVDLKGLSHRECQVVELLSRGLSNKEIASELGISLSTTKTHVGKVFKHLGISSRRELLPRFYRLARVTDVDLASFADPHNTQRKDG